MKYCVRSLIMIFLVTHNHLYSAIPYFNIRSQSADAARQLAGMTRHLYKENPPHPYGTLSARIDFGKTFNGDQITRAFFDPYLTCEGGEPGLSISGSAVANRGSKDLLADYFYLPPDYRSTVTFNPSIKNFLVEFGMYAGLDDWFKGMYFMINMPLVHTRWELHLKENILSRGVLAQPAGTFASIAIDRNNLLNDFKEYANGNSNTPITNEFTATVATVPATTIDQFYATVLQPLQHAQMSCDELTRTRLADIRARLGIVILNTDEYQMGINVQTAAPTGNRPKGIYLFEPIVGNSHHWELGMGAHGRYTFWQREDNELAVSLYVDTNITHLFDSAQTRTFDLNGKPLSRYMLATRLGTPVNFNLQGGSVTPPAQFKDEMAPVANITSTKVKVSIGAQVDAVAMMNVAYRGFDFDLGYNFWFRSAEHIRHRELSYLEIYTNEWALKGDARVYGFASADDTVAPVIALNEPIPLSATQSNATILTGLNGTNTVNAMIDDAQLATAGGSSTALNNSPTIGASQINTSRNPVFLKEIDVNVHNSSTAALTNKFFGHINHTWDDRIRWLPSIGLGFEMEFDDAKNVCDSCEIPRCAASQWAFWVNIDMSFE